MLTFYIVDVFAERKYTGNQLAVFHGSPMPSSEEMQQIAHEMNYSETTFITSTEPHDGGYDVRIFTADQEVPFAGHPTLGTAYIIQRELIQQAVEKVTLNLQVGQIPVSFSYKDGRPDFLWMQQKPPVFGGTFAAETIAEMLNIDPSDIDDRFPIQTVSTGLPFIIVPLRNLAAVKRCRVNLDKYFSVLRDTKFRALHLFCPETYHVENQLNARMFFGSSYDCSEDPATGSANGCLAGYLVKHRYFGTDSLDIRVEQGYEINRPSLLLLRAHQAEGEQISVSVGGQVFMVAQGQWVVE